MPNRQAQSEQWELLNSLKYVGAVLGVVVAAVVYGEQIRGRVDAQEKLQLQQNEEVREIHARIERTEALIHRVDTQLQVMGANVEFIKEKVK